MRNTIILLALLLCLSGSFLNAQSKYSDVARDTGSFTIFRELPLKPNRNISFTTGEGTWTSLDVSPDGKTIAFDLMGDIYTIPVTGGTATRVTKGIAFDSHPRFSPDGKKILFTSDRSGGENLWWIDREKKDTFQVTKEKDQNFPSACWTPDGDYIVYSKGKRIVQLYMVHRNGGAGTQLIDSPALFKTIDPAVGANGKLIYFSGRIGSWNYNASMPQYQVGVFNRENGKIQTITSHYGAGFTPLPSKDGKWLVYGSRFEEKTGLVIRNLETGDEKWLAYPVQRDDQESIATMGVLPGMAFTPDSKAVIVAYGGRIHRIPIDGSAPSEIPYTAEVQLELGPRLEFKYPLKDTAYAKATQIRDAVPSPDGKKLAFTALDRLYLMDYPKGIPMRLTTNEFTEAQPTWSRDGKSIVFVSWTPRGGNLYKVDLATAISDKKAKNNKSPFAGISRLTRLNKLPGLYQHPAFDPKGERIVFTRSTVQRYKDAFGPIYDDTEDELCWIPAGGGDITIIDKAYGRYNPHFVQGEDRIYLNRGDYSNTMDNRDGNLLSIKWDGTDEKTIAHVTGITTSGFSLAQNGMTASNEGDDGRFNRQPLQNRTRHLTEDAEQAAELTPASAASRIILSPNGKRALVLIHNEIYLTTIPKTGKLVNISLADANAAQWPSRRLTELGGEFPAWESDSRKAHWSLGNAHFVYDVDAAEAFDDSVKTAKKIAEKRIADSLAAVKADNLEGKTRGDTALFKAKSVSPVSQKDTSAGKYSKKAALEYRAVENEVKVYYAANLPSGTILFKGARIITMEGETIIADGDLLVENNRIKTIGEAGTISTPANTRIIDAKGKTIIPGFVDTHAHMWPQWGIHKNQDWQYATNLAYGVTTTRDPQTATTDVLTYSDLVNAGKMAGPRIYSTGPGVGYWDYNVKDSAQAEDILRQYSKYYHTNYIKMYLTGNRQQRQWIIMAARNQQLMPTTEGGLNLKLNITNLLDGYPGHEHAIPVFPLYMDLIGTIAKAQMCVTPTLLVSYGGPWAENYFWETENPYHNSKLQYFMPNEELAGKTRRVKAGWFMPEEQVFPKHAQSMKALVEAGGLAGIGSHGEFQGIGYHWEMWAMASGGMKPMDVLRTATILGATGLGLDKDLGSLKAGKLADLVVLNKNPLEDIRNTNSIIYVMKNGRLYDANTCNEIYPDQRELDKSEWISERPVNNTGLKE